ncbi:endonuclease/exonuclease/phosphatase family protein [Streptomyces sp. NPDC000878]
MDGNDPRLIDVAVLSRFPITHIRSHQHFLDPASPTTALFSRDCLEVDVEVGAGASKRTVTLYVNHFKSMSGGRRQTREKRVQQAAKVRELVTERFGPTPGDSPFVILGDLNDYMETNAEGSPAIGDLVDWDQVENVVTRLPTDEQWTHFWAEEDEYRQLDYLLPSASLAAATVAVPEIFRQGLPLRAVKYTGPHLIGVGKDKPKASDHCPVVFELEVA